MIYERIRESVGDSRCEIQFVFFLKTGKHGDDLIIESLVHIAADHVIIHAVSHDVLPCKICTHDHGGVRAV